MWQGSKLIAECAEKDTVWRTYLYEPDSFRPLALVEGNAKKGQKRETYWYQNDHLGTPHSLTDSLGEVVYSCTYNAYGQVQKETQHQQAERRVRVENNLRFQGQYWDEETGLHYNLNRYYDPGLGRYLTPDPIKLAGGLNAYQYVYGNPISWIDPSGLVGMPRSPGQIYKDPITGADTVHMGNGPTSQSDLDRLAFDSAKGKNIYHEAEAAAKLEKTYGGTLERIPEMIGTNGKTVSQPDFVFLNGPMQGKTLDFMWTTDSPLSVQKMNEMFQKTKFLKSNNTQLTDHLNKADIVPLDYRNLTLKNQELVNQWILKLDPARRNQILIMKD